MNNVQFPQSAPLPDKKADITNKPSKEPTSSKSFSEVQDDSKKAPVSEKEEKPKDVSQDKKAEENQKKKKSLFDLQKKGPDEASAANQQEKAPKMPPEGKLTPQQLQQLQQQKELLAKEAAAKGEKLSGAELGEGEGVKKGKLSLGEKGEGRPELAAVDQQSKQNPFSETSTQIDTKTGREEGAKPAQTIQQIVDKIVEKIQTVRTGDKIDTAITLKSPPMLEGATVTVTSSASVKGEIEIAFSNLSQDAKALIDQNTASLKLALEKNGYTVHDVVTVPKEIQAAPMSAEASKEQREGQRDQGQQQGGGEGGGGKGRQQQQQQQRNR